jgi:hypothetical protein
MSNQIETQVDVTLTERNRVTALFRLILVAPIAIFLATFAPSWSTNSESLTVGFLVLPVALALVFRQVYPSYLLAFNEAFLSLQTRVSAYVDAKALNRWLPLIKWLLAIPLYIVGIAYIFYGTFLTLFAWISILFSGKFPEFCAEGIVGVIAYWNRVVGYALLLVTDEYPTFSL